MSTQFPDIPTLCPRPVNLPAPDLDAAAADALRLLPRGPLTVLVNDPQRHTDTPAVLAAIARLVPPADTRLLVATGSHSRPASAAAFEGQLTRGLPYADVQWHDSRSERLRLIGGAGGWHGHPWLLAEGGLLAIGSVEPHYFAGFTGAHKTATIGVAAYGDIEANHAWAVHCASRPCRTDGNPVYSRIEGLLADLQRLRPLAAINLVQVGERIVFAAGGDMLATLGNAAVVAQRIFVAPIDAPADALIADVTGPLGQSFYQADKGIKNSEWAVRDGGVLVLQAPCPQAIGQDAFVRLLRDAADYDAAMALVNARGYRLGDHKAVRLRYLTDARYRGVRVYVVSAGLAAADAQLLGLIKADSVASALAAAGIDPRHHRVYHIHDAGNVCVTTADA